MILGFPRAKQGLCHTNHGGAGGIILWALLTVFLVWNDVLIFDNETLIMRPDYNYEKAQAVWIIKKQKEP